MSSSALQSPSIRYRRTVAANAPAKINLILEVLDSRPDGYHDIHSLAVGVDLHDRLSCSWPNTVGVTLNCSDRTLHPDENLAIRAALMLARCAGCDPQVEIDLQKRIPIGAGLGGGSSDAATAMRLCNELWGTGLTELEMSQMGAELGSDVPLFFQLPAVEMFGRGECVAPFSLRWSGFVLLVIPGIHASTADVYKAWREEDGVASDKARFEVIRDLTRAEELHHLIHNELEPALVRVCPRIKELQESIVSMGLPSTCVTGSGSTFFRLYDDQDRARHAARTIQSNIPGMRVEVVACPVSAPALEHKEP